MHRAGLATIRAGEPAPIFKINVHVKDLLLPFTFFQTAAHDLPRRWQAETDFKKMVLIHPHFLPTPALPAMLRVHSGTRRFYKFPPNACRGERCGVWGRIAPIKPVRSSSFCSHPEQRSAKKFHLGACSGF
jgi:hypothetical protein